MDTMCDQSVSRILKMGFWDYIFLNPVSQEEKSISGLQLLVSTASVIKDVSVSLHNGKLYYSSRRRPLQSPVVSCLPYNNE